MASVLRSRVGKKGKWEMGKKVAEMPDKKKR